MNALFQSNTGRYKNRPTVFLAALLFPLLLALPLFQTARLAVDGDFSDWSEQLYISDPSSDGPTPNTDILNFYWGTNPDEDFIYWMMERQEVSSGNPRAYYFVFMDLNDNGSTSDPADRQIQVFYDPQKDTSSVILTLSDGTGAFLSETSGDWGDSTNEGGRRVEWRVSFEDLGIDRYTKIQMSAGASQSGGIDNIDRLPEAGDITWTPVPVLGWPILIALVSSVILFTWYRFGRKAWHPI